MAFLLKEMTRYNMGRDLIITHHPGYEKDYYSIIIRGPSTFNGPICFIVFLSLTQVPKVPYLES